MNPTETSRGGEPDETGKVWYYGSIGAVVGGYVGLVVGYEEYNLQAQFAPARADAMKILSDAQDLAYADATIQQHPSAQTLAQLEAEARVDQADMHTLARQMEGLPKASHLVDAAYGLTGAVGGAALLAGGIWAARRYKN